MASTRVLPSRSSCLGDGFPRGEFTEAKWNGANAGLKETANELRVDVAEAKVREWRPGSPFRTVGAVASPQVATAYHQKANRPSRTFAC